MPCARVEEGRGLDEMLLENPTQWIGFNPYIPTFSSDHASGTSWRLQIKFASYLSLKTLESVNLYRQGV